MRQILLLTDFSETAHTAILYAQNLWANAECQFHFMHVVSSSGYTTESLLSGNTNADVYSSVLKSTKVTLTEAFEALKDQNTNSNHQFKCHLDHDGFVDAIDQLIKKERIDYVVMGSNGASSVTEVLFGSHALKVMRYLKHNIMVIPEDFMFTPIAKVLLLLGKNDRLTPEHTRRVNRFLEFLKAGLHVLTIDANTDQNTNMIESELTPVQNFQGVRDVPLDHAASTYIQTNGIDLVILIDEMEDFFERLRGQKGKTNLSKLYRTPLLLIRN